MDSTVTYGAFAQEEDGAFHPERHTVYQAYRPEEGQTIDVSSGSGPQTPPPAPSSEPQTPPPAPSSEPQTPRPLPADRRNRPGREDRSSLRPGRIKLSSSRQRKADRGKAAGSESHGEGEDR